MRAVFKQPKQNVAITSIHFNHSFLLLLQTVIINGLTKCKKFHSTLL
jgi:hypothetical protein